MLDGSAWPRITIVTPSYNQGEFIEETIRSVLLQGYPNLEYFINDGGSQDNSVEIIQKYSSWITNWISEPDQGQADAINRGFKQSSGQLLGSINSDDSLLPMSLKHLAIGFKRHPNAILLGNVINLDEKNDHKWTISQRNVTFEKMSQPWRYGVTWHHPGTYFPRILLQHTGLYDERLRYRFDWDWMCRALQVADVIYLPQPVAQFRYHPDSKTIGEASQWFEERALVIRRFWPEKVANSATLASAVDKIMMAESELLFYRMNRKNGIDYLWSALLFNYQVLSYPRFWMLFLKTLVPDRILMFLRAVMKGF